MDDQEYEEYQRMQQERRKRRAEMKRKRILRQRIFYTVVVVILLLLIVIFFRSCGTKTPAPAASASPSETVSATEDTVSVVQQTSSTTVTLSAVGDIMVYDDQLTAAKGDGDTYDFSSVFSGVSSDLSAADLTVGNFEANLCGSEGGYTGFPDFRAPESIAANLASAGFDILQTANTYSIQNGIAGLQSTISYLDSAGLNHVGTYASESEQQENGGVLLKEVNGVKIAFIAFTKGVNNMSIPEGSEYCVNLLYKDYDSNYSEVNTDGIKEQITAAKALDPDVIVAMVHWGSEFETEISDTQDQIADLMFENGVDVILGTHSHIVGKIEQRSVTTDDGTSKNCFIAYSLGNFMAAQSNNYSNEGLLLTLSFTKDSATNTTTVSNVAYEPLYLLDNGESSNNRYEIVSIAAAMQAHDENKTGAVDDATYAKLQQALTDLSDHTGISFSADTAAGSSGAETSAATSAETGADASAAASPETSADAAETSAEVSSETSMSAA